MASCTCRSLAQGNDRPGLRSLILSLSGRYDHYSDFGSTTNPKVGLTWVPLDGLSLRGSYGRSFRAPGLRDSARPSAPIFSTPRPIAGSTFRDPSRGAAQVDTIFLFGGNHGLEPETARTWSFGVDLRPVASARTSPRASPITTSTMTNVIGTPRPAALRSAIRPSPRGSSATRRRHNWRADREHGAVLLHLRRGARPDRQHPRPPAGQFRRPQYQRHRLRYPLSADRPASATIFAGIAGNYILKYQQPAFADASARSNSLQPGIPRTTLRTTLGFTAGPVTFVNFVNHRSGVTASYATPTGTGRLQCRGLHHGRPAPARVRLPNARLRQGHRARRCQINDLFDATPPFFPGTDGIGGAYNPIGRYAAMSLRTAFLSLRRRRSFHGDRRPRSAAHRPRPRFAIR